MKLYIKNMVCSRCKWIVKSELEKLGLDLVSVDLGEVELVSDIDETKKKEVAERLKPFGFVLIHDKKSKTIESLKTLMIDLVQNKSNELEVNLSEYLSSRLLQDYNSLSTLFSEVEGSTIEKYFINLKIEKIKELIIYDELTLSEIAFQLNYSSVAYLSNQFKKVTGFTPTYFKQLKAKKRRQIEDL